MCSKIYVIIMDGMDKLYLQYKSVAMYSAVANAARPLAELITAPDRLHRISSAAEVFRAVADSGCDSTGEWIAGLVLADDNPFSRAAARGERISPKVKAQVRNELLTFKQLSLIKPSEFEGDASGFFPQFGFGGFSVTYDGLVQSYANSGCGILSGADSFVYRDGMFKTAAIRGERLSDLKGYIEEKYEIEKNTKSFVDGLPAFHTLLYGERGMGKSATVRAVAGEFCGRLKLIEIADIAELPELVKRIRGLKQKFIIFADAVDLGAWEANRAATDRVLDAAPDNFLVYCTIDRARDGGDGYGGQTYGKAELALFDRFGLVVTYLSPDSDGFVDILKQILRSRAIKWRDEYGSVAELAARKKGGRSPRAAKQIADLIECTYAQKRCD
ncbi:MAG: ATP-binding protein [Clostridiales bacterium]|nr:ATP-binding protein [Clostridiales bacterium]